jgi:uncharacterized integral membrane protein
VYNFLGNVVKLERNMATWHVFPVIVFSVNSDDTILMIYLLTAIGLTPGGSSTVHIYTQTIYRTTQLTILVGRLSGIQTQSGQTKINDELTA